MILHRSRRNESSKHVCYFENCYKEYGTKGALVFHIKHKHKETDPIKKDHINISRHAKSNYSFGKLLNDAKNYNLNGLDLLQGKELNQQANTEKIVADKELYDLIKRDSAGKNEDKKQQEMTELQRLA